MAEESRRLQFLRDKLKNKLMTELDEVYINGSMEHRLPHNLNISFAYVEGESLLMGINDVAVSSGSACTSATLEPSYVLKHSVRAMIWLTHPSASASAVSIPKKRWITSQIR
jgi:cysteine desulfurase